MINILNKKNIINYFSKNKSNFLLAILCVIIINILLKSEILYDFIWGGELFGDYKENIYWLSGTILVLMFFRTLIIFVSSVMDPFFCYYQLI